MCVADSVKEWFRKQLQKAVDLIQDYEIEYEEIGVFGSYARNEYKATSDIDLCIITEQKPDRHISGSLREEAELLHVDIVFVTMDYFEHSTEPFAQQLRRDYRRVL